MEAYSSMYENENKGSTANDPKELSKELPSDLSYKMKKKGAKGAPSAANFKRAAMTVRKK